MLDRASLGRIGEEETTRRLTARGFTILGRNVRIGRLELDIVAARRGRVIAVEVRSRTTVAFGHPAETIDAEKRKRVRRAFLGWLTQEGVVASSIRLDVAALVLARDGTVRSFRYYADAF